MKLTQAYTLNLLAKYGVHVMEACDKCGQILGPVRFKRQGESGDWCSRKCRGDRAKQSIRKGGRPRKYKTEVARRQAERRQNTKRQRAFRERVQRNGKPLCNITKTNGLQGQNSPLP
jgi:hypothetical protein